jgi:hypothetical protein
MIRSGRRLAIVVGALLTLSTVGAGLAQAASDTQQGSVSATAPTMITASTDPTAAAPQLGGERLRALSDRLLERGLGRFGRHLVHATVTFLDRNGDLVTLQFDHGTVSAISDGSLTIAEAGGSSVTVATTDETRVRKGRQPAELTDLAVGDDIVVVSTLDSGAATARRIVMLPAAPTAGGGGS